MTDNCKGHQSAARRASTPTRAAEEKAERKHRPRLLLSDLVTAEADKAEVFNAFFNSLATSPMSLWLQVVLEVMNCQLGQPVPPGQ